MNSNLQDAFRGCLIGGACGDALGYPVEFMRLKEIKKRFGPEGILKLEGKNGAAVISDDTQMTLFTAAGLLEAGRRKAQLNSPQWQQAMWELLREWKDTQSFDRKIKKRYSWLWKVSALHERRAPGITCLSALEEEEPGTFDKPKNNSKGCGGVMRTAPVGLFFSPKRHTRMEILKGGALAAVQTHGHLMGCLPAGMLSLMVNDAAYAPEKSLKEIAREALRDTLRFGRALSGAEEVFTELSGSDGERGEAFRDRTGSGSGAEAAGRGLGRRRGPCGGGVLRSAFSGGFFFLPCGGGEPRRGQRFHRSHRGKPSGGRVWGMRESVGSFLWIRWRGRM